MHLGIGCAVENLLLAAEASGYRWSFDTAGPCGDPKLQPILRILLKESTRRPSDLYAAIPRRHTDRGPYATHMEVDPRAIAALNNLKNSDTDLRVFWFQNNRDMRAFADLVISATEAIIADREQSASSDQWIRTNWRDIQLSRDGLTYEAQGLSPSMRIVAKFLPPLSAKQANRFWLNATRDVHLATASAFGMIATRDAQDAKQLLEAGRLWQRMHLCATVHGVSMHPLSQPVERRDREIQLLQPPTFAKALADLQQDDGWQAVMPFRLGYPTRSALPSPRREIASVLI